MQRPVHPSFGWEKTVVDGRNTGGRVKDEGAKKGSKTIDIFSYALEVSVNGVTCVFIVYFWSSDTFYSL